MRAATSLSIAAACAAAGASAVTITKAGLAPRQTSAPTAITDCHLHASDLYCMVGTAEYHVDIKVTATTDLPTKYTDCHSHGEDLYCVDDAGEDVAVHAEGGEAEEEHDHNEEEHDHEEEGHDHSEEETHTEEAGAEETAASGQNCHFHAGVEHCTGGEEETASEEETSTENQQCHFHAGVEHCVGGDSDSESSEGSGSSSSRCGTRDRDYDVNLRVGLLFVILATSALGVFGPILLQKFVPTKLNTVFIVMKQFGTGIIISTAFVHLYTHAFLMFSNECIGELGYEGTTSAIAMAGMFLSFLVEYIGQRIVLAKAKASAALSPEERSKSFVSPEVVTILVMEVGILFHSLLIGLTLVVAGDEYFITLFIVIIFHQMFEGIALGSRIATIGTRGQPVVANIRTARASSQETDKAVGPADTVSSDDEVAVTKATTGLTLMKKLGLASLFAFITPIGMAIGIGVLGQFNGNDKSTLIAIGTLDALSVGILAWVGLVEMWAADWMTGAHGHPAELAEAGPLTTALALFGLIAGLIVMSALGKWA